MSDWNAEASEDDVSGTSSKKPVKKDIFSNSLRKKSTNYQMTMMATLFLLPKNAIVTPGR